MCICLEKLVGAIQDKDLDYIDKNGKNHQRHKIYTTYGRTKPHRIGRGMSHTWGLD